MLLPGKYARRYMMHSASKYEVRSNLKTFHRAEKEKWVGRTNNELTLKMHLNTHLTVALPSIVVNPPTGRWTVVGRVITTPK